MPSQHEDWQKRKEGSRISYSVGCRVASYFCSFGAKLGKLDALAAEWRLQIFLVAYVVFITWLAILPLQITNSSTFFALWDSMRSPMLAAPLYFVAFLPPSCFSVSRQLFACSPHETKTEGGRAGGGNTTRGRRQVFQTDLRAAGMLDNRRWHARQLPMRYLICG